MTQPLAFSFDLFGTVVDWRTGIARESSTYLARIGRGDLDPAAFADQWRARYVPAMKRAGERPGFVVLDRLHREMLADLLDHHGIDSDSLDPALLTDWAEAWRRLDPWPDSVAGLARLRTIAPCVTLSNANVALAVAMARHAGLAWDAVLGADVTGRYKPHPDAYLGTARLLGIDPGRLCHVAAHHSDLAAARAQGLLTAYVARPAEYDGAPAPDRDQAQNWNWQVASLAGLADALGA